MRAAPFPETAIFERGIDTALDGDQTNLLLVGAVHQVEKNLPRDIMVRRFDT